MLKILNFRELYLFPITRKVFKRDENFFLLFKADEIAFDIKYVVSMEAP